VSKLDSFGEWLRQRRSALGLTRVELAECAGCSVSALRKIEADERRPSRQLAQLLAGCLRIAPDEQPAFVEAARGARRVARLAAPQLTAGSFVPNALPIPATPLIGRNAELATLVSLLGDVECRLLTLAGPGGIGKTRLALEVAHTRQDAFDNGAFFVSMASVGSPEHMAPAIAQVIGLSFSGPAAPGMQLLYHLSNKRMLLVLDNLEHLLEGVDLLVEILGRAPEVKLLVTSRERLALRGEWIVEIEGLPVPADHLAEELEGYGAVALFLQRARRTLPGFEPSGEDWRAMVHICRLLGGMPLAIELAAAWLPMLTCQEIAQEVEQSLDFLTTTMRDMPQRHRSMRAVLAYSWRLLADEEQRALRWLAIFRGGFTRQAAQAVAGADLQMLRALIGKSHLSATDKNRYEMHELLRQFGQEMLEGSGETGRARGAHRRYYLNAVAARLEDLAGGDQLVALSEIEADLDNVRLAWGWALKTGAEEEIGRSLRSLHLFFNLLSRYHEGIAFFQEVTARFAPEAGAEPGPAWRIAVPYLAYTAAVAGVGTEEMKRDLGLCLEMAREAGEALQVADCLLALAFYQMFMERDAGSAVLSGEQSLEHFRAVDDLTGACWTLIWLSFFHEQNGRPDLARACGEEGLEIAMQTGNRVGIPFALNRFAATALCEGDYGTAENHYRQALEMAEEINHWQTIAGSQTGLAVVHFLKGELEQALAMARECLGAALKINFPLARSTAQAAYRLCASISEGQLLAANGDDKSLPRPGTSLFVVIVHWANALRACGKDEEAAWEELKTALQCAHDSGYPALATWLLPVAAVLLARKGHPRRATELLALASSHPLSTMGWTDHWAALTEVRARLQEALGSDGFAATWRQGAELDLEEQIGVLLLE